MRSDGNLLPAPSPLADPQIKQTAGHRRNRADPFRKLQRLTVGLRALFEPLKPQVAVATNPERGELAGDVAILARDLQGLSGMSERLFSAPRDRLGTR